MSPQLEDGYTRIADTILEKVAQTKLNGTQFRILMIVWRSTYGWQKKEHELSETFLSKATNIHKQQIKRELRTLIQSEILTVIKEPTFNTGRVIAFNKNYVNSTQVSKTIPPIELDTPTGSENDTPTGSGLDTQKRELNKQYKDTWKVVDYYKYICSEFPQPRKITKVRESSINARIKDYGLAEVLYSLEVVSESKFLNESIGTSWLSFDWIFNPNNFVKIIEGKYKAKKSIVYENDKSKGHIIGSKCNTGTITRRPKVFEE